MYLYNYIIYFDNKMTINDENTFDVDIILLLVFSPLERRAMIRANKLGKIATDRNRRRRRSGLISISISIETHCSRYSSGSGGVIGKSLSERITRE